MPSSIIIEAALLCDVNILLSLRQWNVVCAQNLARNKRQLCGLFIPFYLISSNQLLREMIVTINGNPLTPCKQSQMQYCIFNENLIKLFTNGRRQQAQNTLHLQVTVLRCYFPACEGQKLRFHWRYSNKRHNSMWERRGKREE